MVCSHELFSRNLSSYTATYTAFFSTFRFFVCGEKTPHFGYDDVFQPRRLLGSWDKKLLRSSFWMDDIFLHDQNCLILEKVELIMPSKVLMYACHRIKLHFIQAGS